MSDREEELERELRIERESRKMQERGAIAAIGFAIMVTGIIFMTKVGDDSAECAGAGDCSNGQGYTVALVMALSGVAVILYAANKR